VDWPSDEAGPGLVSAVRAGSVRNTPNRDGRTTTARDRGRPALAAMPTIRRECRKAGRHATEFRERVNDGPGWVLTSVGDVCLCRSAESARTAKGFKVDKRRILLAGPLQPIGEVTVPLKIHRDVTAQLKNSRKCWPSSA
jgi:hypothetical protein